MTYDTKNKKFQLDGTYIYIYIYISMGWVQVTSRVTLNNVTSPNNLLLNQCFENPTVELYVQSDDIYHLIYKFIFYALF